VTYSQEYHWFKAARWAHYRWTEFLELDGDIQAMIVAAFETDGQIDGVVTEDLKHDGK
jgi:hypothetical protein